MMVYYSILFISFFLLALSISLFRKFLHGLALNSVGLVDKLMTGGDDDDEKIKIISKSTNRLLASLGKTLLLFLVAILVGAVPLALYCVISNLAYSELDFLSLYPVLAISAGATIAFIIPISKRKDNLGYSELARLLHRMALDNYNISNRLFKRERKKIRKKGIGPKNEFVVISGLARAGTTSLMNDLAEIHAFKSLSYANMPYLMAPNTWAKFYKPKSKKLKERSHKDGIKIGLNSNEALEEYFFKVKADDSYVFDDRLEEYSISEDDYKDYLDYHAVIRKNNNKIYLAKNNNFILRYKSVRAFNDDFLMVILFRDPLTHAASLLAKHHDYLQMQEQDTFILEYMNWLGHHEFGQNQKHFIFSNSKEFEYSDKDSLNYWLESWINYYSYALSIEHPNTIFVNYDEFCEKPKDIVSRIISKMKIQIELPEYENFTNKRKTVDKYSEELLAEAQGIFEKLCEK